MEKKVRSRAVMKQDGKDPGINNWVADISAMVVTKRAKSWQKYPTIRMGKQFINRLRGCD